MGERIKCLEKKQKLVELAWQYHLCFMLFQNRLGINKLKKLRTMGLFSPLAGNLVNIQMHVPHDTCIVAFHHVASVISR